MPRQIITTANAPKCPLYSQGVKAGPYVLVSGLVGIDPGTGSLAGDTIQAQTRQALTNCQAILRPGTPPWKMSSTIHAALRPAALPGLHA